MCHMIYRGDRHADKRLSLSAKWLVSVGRHALIRLTFIVSQSGFFVRNWQLNGEQGRKSLCLTAFAFGVPWPLHTGTPLKKRDLLSRHVWCYILKEHWMWVFVEPILSLLLTHHVIFIIFCFLICEFRGQNEFRILLILE